MTLTQRPLHGRTAFITGASSGLGLHFAHLLAGAGASVALAARRTDSAMADALSHTRYWPAGALTPAINLVAVFRHGTVPDADGEALLEQLHLCLAQYVRHAESD